MKIAMVSEHANPLAALGEEDAGGQNVHVAGLASALAARGHRVTVFARRDDPDVPELVHAKGYDVVHVPAGPAAPVPKDDLLPHMNDFTRFLARHWRDDTPDVVHSHFWMSGMASVLAARTVEVPVVHTYHALGTVKRRHQGSADTSPAKRIGIERMVGKQADAIVATCTDEVFELVRMGLSRQKVTVVPSGVDTQRFSPDGRGAPKSTGHRIVSVGRLVPRKGFAEVISALRLLPDTELVIAGGGADVEGDPQARALLEHAGSVGVRDRVRLTGRVSRRSMPALLRSADVVVCAPWYEPFGIVPLEAMACSVPVVATAVGGLVDTVVDGVTGLLVPPRDPVALAKALRSLLADPTQRQALGLAGYDRVQARYLWEHVAQATEEVYLRVGAGAAVEAADMVEVAR
ncbi:Glycosyl transferase, group 1 [Actinokineospora spheciospongiae]|uniref:Glycosyl transferase, group 1 n=1 Tax=Actinokineospora spheciospongiae TaxID=909613 RepID=W7IQS0_9PSEU|nr:glycosyltransferase [Actinokineospora spheciospongiae]EWC63215.1 Glycosyl transferase, group 1 [Actinokineospora spheciospongiae]